MKNVEVFVKEVVIKSITVEVPDNVENIEEYCWEQVCYDEGELQFHVESSQVELVKVKENEE